ncbi:MAG: hypothetical protein AAF755_05005 [Pseudomonadota bacterium]
MVEPTPSEKKKASAARTGSLGIFDRPNPTTVTSVEVIALALSLLWLAGAAFFFLFTDSAASAADARSLQFLMTMLAVFMPVAMIWVAATAAKASRVMREESLRLQTSIDAIRQAYIAQQQSLNSRTESSMAKKLDEIAATARKTETTLATFQTRRDGTFRPPLSPPPNALDDQPALALGTQAADLAPDLGNEDFIRALNFPETAEDHEGFAALRRAMKDRTTAQVIQAAQDILTLLSQDGIYMDDLRPDRAAPEVWRRFAKGERGAPIAQLGGIHDRSSLALTNGRMKQDAIFRDTAHHFLRHFDRAFAVFEKRASDAEIAAASDTRTARAFMLLGRCAGTFD